MQKAAFMAVCPFELGDTKEYRGDGTAVCEECNFHFGVVECEED